MKRIGEKLFEFLNSKKKSTTTEAPEGYCPNCWGYQEYGGNFYEAVAKEPAVEVGWVQNYADKHLSEIQLIEKDDMRICEKCKVTYRPA